MTNTVDDSEAKEIEPFELTPRSKLPAQDRALLDNDHPLLYFDKIKEMQERMGDEYPEYAVDFLQGYRFRGEHLTARQQLFVAELMADPEWNPVAAYRRAGFVLEGDERTPAELRRGALAILNRPAVSHALRTVIQGRMLRLGVKQERVLEEVAKVAYTNLSDVATWDAEGNITLKPIDEIPPHALAALNEINQTRGPNGTTTKLKLEGKLAALNTLMKHLGMFTQKIQMDVNVTTSDALTRARERVIEAKRKEHVEAENAEYERLPSDPPADRQDRAGRDHQLDREGAQEVVREQ